MKTSNKIFQQRNFLNEYFIETTGTRFLSPACHDPDVDLVQGSSSYSFDSAIVVQNGLKYNRRQTIITYIGFPKGRWCE